MISISAIVSTYNRSGHLLRCLAGLETQTRPPDEIIVTDDGSSGDHVAAIQEALARCPIPTRFVRQPDEGFRLAACHNKGVRASSGDWLLFLDGDVVLFPDAIEKHLEIGEAGRFWVTGYFLALDEGETTRLTPQLVMERKLPLIWPGASDARVKRMTARELRLQKRLRVAKRFPLERCRRRVPFRTGQASVLKSDFVNINGFDEAYVGWGCEDSDLGLRLQLAGVAGRSAIEAARALHQYHPVEDRVVHNGRLVSVNFRYYQRRRGGKYVCEQGLY